MRIKRRSILVNGIIVACTGFVLLYFYRYVTPEKQSTLLESVVDSIGLTVTFFGQLLRISARGYKSQQINDNASLVTTGPYSLVRHPMYLGSFLIGLGIVIVLLRIWTIPVYIILYSLWYGWQIYIEEKHLCQKFGQAYQDYSKTTPRFFPSVKDLIGLKLERFMPLRLKWIKKEWITILVWVLVVAFFEGCYELRQYGFIALLKESIFLILLMSAFIILVFISRGKE